jgi:hypothetical protein
VGAGRCLGPDLKLGASVKNEAAAPVVTVESFSKIKLSWRTSEDAAYCEAEGGWTGPKTVNGEEIVTLGKPGTSSYVLNCFNKDGFKSVAFAVAIVKKGNLP